MSGPYNAPGGGILIRLGRDIRGVAAVEFAFIAPLLILFYMGIADTFTVAQTIMAPFPTTTLKMRITAITANSAGVAKVVWSDGYGGLAALAVNTTVAVPAGVISANQSVIMSEVQYTHASTLHYVMPANMAFSQKYYLRPRLSDQVARVP